MFKRIAAGLIGGFNLLNGSFMLFDPHDWYMRTPGVAATGPFNAHLVADVGAAFIAAGLAQLVRAWRGRYWTVAVAGSAFPVFHALIHIFEFAAHAQDVFVVTWIVLLAAFGLWAALPTEGERHA
jgi:hypothetical protein